jgi:hypothetical protein
MSTKYKPIINEPETVWSTPAKAILKKVLEQRSYILETLNFYEEHGHLGWMDGKFDDRITCAADEVLAELAGFLTLALARAAEAPTGVAIATLEWVKKNPSAAQGYTLPGFAEWLLAAHYQRNDEDEATYYPDIMGFAPNGFHDTIQIPAKESIISAASAAIDALSSVRRAGRPSSEATRILGEGLREMFLRFNTKITRRSEISSRHGELVQVEAGPFFDFVCAAIIPLQDLLRERGLPPVTAESIVRFGRYPISPITVRFKIGPSSDEAPESRHSAATKENDDGKSGSQAEQ